MMNLNFLEGLRRMLRSQCKVKERTLALEESRLDIIWLLGKIAEFRDAGVGNHIIRVEYYCRVIAESPVMNSDFVDTLFLTSPLHDIGKIGIPDKPCSYSGDIT